MYNGKKLKLVFIEKNLCKVILRKKDHFSFILKNLYLIYKFLNKILILKNICIN